MVKYILSAGIGVLLCSIVYSQQEPAADLVETVPDLNSAPILNTENKIWSRFDLSKEGDVLVHANEIKLYSGTVKKRKLHGSWQSWYSNEQLCDSGTFFKGVPVGEWKHWDMNGQLIAIRHYDATKLMRIKNEFLHSGPKQVVYPLTALYKKNKPRAVRYIHAGYSFSFVDHHPYEFSLLQAVENNITPGNSYRPLFDECLHHGLYMNFYPDGYVKDSGYYKNGLRDGIWLHRDITGYTMMGMYKDGQKQGDWKQYDKKGKFLSVIFYNKKGEEAWRKKIRE